MTATRQHFAGTVSMQATLQSSMTAAHGQIEKTFLEGGAVLVSVIEILNSMVGMLDQLTGLLDEGTTATMIGDLRNPVANLARLPDHVDMRRVKFEELHGLCSLARGRVDDMRETIRYLRTFAVTVKITGAGIADFSEFAEEIRARIQSGAAEVENFSSQLCLMIGELDKARSFSSAIRNEFDGTIPKIVSNLTDSCSQISEQHRTLANIAAQVRSAANAFQGKIGSVLSGLQIGDISRQRIEHVQTMLQFFDEFAAGPDGDRLGADGVETLRTVIHHLADAQLQETVDDFTRGCDRIGAIINSFNDNATEILALRDQLTAESGGDDRDVLKTMETDISNACSLAMRVESSGVEANVVVDAVISSSRRLLQGIELVRSIQTDIHYMALNSNLRCSRLGDAGRSVNVVSGELRNFSSKLDAPVDAMVGELQQVETTAELLSGKTGDGTMDITGPLNHAIDTLRTMSGTMRSGMKTFASEGQTVFARISRETAKLDFAGKLGHLLERCRDVSSHMAQDPCPNDPIILEAAADLSARIYSIYTMTQERDIHERYLPLNQSMGAARHTPQSAAPVDDDELFADALF